MKVRFFPSYTPSRAEWVELNKIVQTSTHQRFVKKSFKYFEKSKLLKVFALKNNNRFISFALILEKKWLIDRKTLKSFFIGLVTTKSKYKNQGFATKLLRKIFSYAKSKKVDYCYLQGLPNFYNKLGFKAFATKRKFIINNLIS